MALNVNTAQLSNDATINESNRKNSLAHAYLLGISSAIFIGLMSSLVPATRLPFSQIAFVRAAICFILILPFSYRYADWRIFFSRANVAGWTFGACGAVSILCLYANLMSGSVGSANALFNATPVFIALIAALVFRQPLSRSTLVGILFVVCGLSSLALPNLGPITPQMIALGLIGALFAAIGYLALSRSSRAPSLLSLYIILLAITPLLPGPPWSMPSLSEACVLVAIAVLSFVGQVLMTRSFARLPVSIAGAIVPTSALWACVFGLLNGQSPTGVEWLACSFTLAGAVLLRVALGSRLELRRDSV